MNIKKQDGTVTSEAAVLRQYFGMQPRQTLTDFMKEVKQLSPESKSEMARAAALALGMTVEA